MLKEQLKTPMMFAKLKKLALDMIPVILGVLIGLLINGWKEKMDDKRYLQKALNAMEQDMTSSLDDLIGVLDSQQMVMDTLMYYAEEEALPLLEIFYKTKGLKAGTIKDIAIEFFVNDRGDLIDYELIAMMAEIRNYKELINEKFDRLAQFINAEMYTTSYQAKEKTAILLADVMGSEKDLVKLYKTYFAQKEDTKGTENN